MKRSYKNILCFIIILILLGLIGFTMYYAYDNTEVDSVSSGGFGEMSGDAPSDIGDMSEMGEIPDSDAAGGNVADGNVTDGNVTGDGEVPDKPNEEVSNGDGTDNATVSNEDVPEKPSDEVDSDMDLPSEAGDIDTEMSVDETVPGTSNDMNFDDTSSDNTSLSIYYYIAFGVESLLLMFVIMYLIMSLGNKKTIKETFNTGDKIIIYILAIIILTAGSTYGLFYICENYIITIDSNSNNLENNFDNSSSTGSSSISYSGVAEITTDTEITSGSYSSENSSENAILISGEVDAKLSGITVTKTGDDDSGDDTSFYGKNSAILAKDGANVTISNIEVETNATGANGVFSYGGSATTSNTSSDGTTITISNSTITTYKDNSGGIMTTGGGIMYAYDLTVTTSGTSSAAIRTDRGGGTVYVDGGTYTTNGSGSPAIYSTADITVKNATLISNVSEGIVIEGKNSVTIDNVTLTDSNTKLNGQSTTYKNIFLYQSVSGDADTGTSEFYATNSVITTNNGDTFYITNTDAYIYLKNNTIINNDSDGNFLRAQADSWGSSGSNGGNVTLVLDNQEASGSIVIDSVSTLTMSLSNSSSFTGSINEDNTAKSVSLTIDSDSTLTLTGNVYVSLFSDDDSTYSNITFNGYHIYVNGVSIN